MRVLITGGAGMLGRKLTQRLVRDRRVAGKPVERLVLHDIVKPEAPADAPFEIVSRSGDISAAGEADAITAEKPDLIFHLAGVVSGEAEADFEKGFRVNLDASRVLFEAIRAGGHRPRVVFTSSIAVFGGDIPDPIADDYHPTPANSYGAAKAMTELLLADYSRRGFIDGVSVRMPAVTVRPGKPNAAASGFYSSIIREPLVGQEAVLPVPDSKRNSHASPRAAIGYLMRAAEIDGGALGLRRSLTMPGVAVTVAEQIEALRRIAGDKVVARIRREPDETIMRIFPNPSVRFDARRALALGFKPDRDFDEIIRIHIEDELGGRIAA